MTGRLFPQKNGLLYKPVPFIETLFCCQLLVWVIGNLSAGQTSVGLICDLFSTAIWLGFVLLVGYEVARFEYQRWQCARYIEKEETARILLDEGHAVILERSGCVGCVGWSECRDVAQSYVISIGARSKSLPGILRGRCSRIVVFGNARSSESDVIQDGGLSENNDWRSQFLSRMILWRPSFLFYSQHQQDDAIELEEFGALLEPTSNIIERLEARPIVISIDEVGSEKRDKRV